MRKIPLKNYFVLLVIVIITIILTLYLSSVYKEKNKTTTVMHEYISEITEKELTDYIIEKPIIFMYISDKFDLTNDQFEEDLKKEIKKNNLKDYFVYLNSSELTTEFINFFKTNYNLEIDVNKTPILVLINDGEVKDIQYIDVTNYNIEQIVKSEVIKW